MKKETIKTLAIIILGIIALAGVGYASYHAIYQDGYTAGYRDGSTSVINYQTHNQKLFYYFNQSIKEIRWEDLCRR